MGLSCNSHNPHKPCLRSDRNIHSVAGVYLHPLLGFLQTYQCTPDICLALESCHTPYSRSRYQPYLNSFPAASSNCCMISSVKNFSGSLLMVLPKVLVPSGNSIRVLTDLKIPYFNARSSSP